MYPRWKYTRAPQRIEHNKQDPHTNVTLSSLLFNYEFIESARAKGHTDDPAGPAEPGLWEPRSSLASPIARSDGSKRESKEGQLARERTARKPKHYPDQPQRMGLDGQKFTPN